MFIKSFRKEGDRLCSLTRGAFDFMKTEYEARQGAIHTAREGWPVFLLEFLPLCNLNEIEKVLRCEMGNLTLFFEQKWSIWEVRPLGEITLHQQILGLFDCAFPDEIMQRISEGWEFPTMAEGVRYVEQQTKHPYITLPLNVVVGRGHLNCILTPQFEFIREITASNLQEVVNNPIKP